MKIMDEILKIVSELSGMEHIEAEHQLQNDLSLDSLQMVTLLIMIEENFGIVLEEADMNPFDLITVLDVVRLLEKYMNGDDNEKES